MSLASLFHYLLLNMFRMLVHPSSGACDLLWIYFMCCIALVRCVLVLRCGSAGMVWHPYAGWSLANTKNRNHFYHWKIRTCYFTVTHKIYRILGPYFISVVPGITLHKFLPFFCSYTVRFEAMCLLLVILYPLLKHIAEFHKPGGQPLSATFWRLKETAQ